MPSWAPQHGLSLTPSHLLLVRSPFLLVRLVIFSLLIYLNLTALVFSAWHVGASRAAGIHVRGASVLLLFNGIATSLCISMALAGAITSSFLITSKVGFECAWTGIFTLLKIAASIFVTLSGPPELCGDARTPLSICASITILVPISWLATILLFGYFVAILALCIAHVRVHPELWSTPIYNVAWFDDERTRRTSAPQLPPLDTSPVHLSITPPRSQDDVENQPPADLNREKPLPSSPNVWWGRMFPGRAGRDHPFTIRRPGGRAPDHYYPSRRTSSSEPREGSARRDNRDRPRAAAATLPYARSHPGHGWQQQRQEMQGDSSRFGVSPNLDPGPSAIVVNEDEPIPLGDRSQWVRATQAPGPYTPPPPWVSGRRK